MTTILLIITVTALTSFLAWRSPSLLDSWLMNPYRINSRGEYHRFLTSGFIHADIGHLLFNMLSLYFFGGIIEQIFSALFGGLGPIYLIGFYLAGILVSDIPSYLKHRFDPGYNSLGASGGVSSVLFAAILFSPLSKIYIYFIPIGIPGFIFGALYLAYSYYESKQNRGNVNHDAHLYGAIFGIVCMIAIYPQVLPQFIEQIASWRIF